MRQLAITLKQYLHFLLGLSECALAITGQANALFEGCQRVFKRQLAVFQALDQCLQLCEGLLEIRGSFFAGQGGALGRR